MTNQPTNNEWIEKAQDEFIALVMSGIDTEESFKTAIEDNLPQSISREAVEKLIEKRNDVYSEYDNNYWDCDYEDVEENLDDFIKDLDALLDN